MEYVIEFSNRLIESGVTSKEYSYWFASILYKRFIRDGAKLLYNNKKETFGTLIDGAVFTSNGISEHDDDWLSWVDYQEGKEKEKIVKKYVDML